VVSANVGGMGGVLGVCVGTLYGSGVGGVLWVGVCGEAGVEGLSFWTSGVSLAPGYADLSSTTGGGAGAGCSCATGGIGCHSSSGEADLARGARAPRMLGLLTGSGLTGALPVLSGQGLYSLSRTSFCLEVCPAPSSW
jgi:hypothetical protein